MSPPATAPRKFPNLPPVSPSHRPIMAYTWQRYLSPRPPHRKKTVQDATVLAAADAIRYRFPTHNGRRAVQETHFVSKTLVREGKSGPPL